MSTYWTSYKWGTAFFPNTLKQQTYLLYAFVREADNIVDDWMAWHEQALKELLLMQDQFHQSMNWNHAHWKELISEFSKLCNKKEIPLERVDDFFDAMKADTQESFYKTYSDLQTYMRGSAEVIGLMMCKLIGYKKEQEEEVFRTAKLLWEAMQYTNFLRDIKEDWHEHWRIYMPLERLQQFDCNHHCVQQFCKWNPINSSREQFMAQQISLTKDLYTEANKGINLLNKQGRFAVFVASRMYEGILDVIWQNTYDVFEKDAHTSKKKKLTLFLQALFSYEF